MIVSNRIDTGSRPRWAEAFGTRINEIESRYPRRLPPLLGGNGLNECYRPYFGTGALHACPELIGLPTLRLFFQNIPIPLCLDDLSKQTALRWIVARAQPRVATARVETKEAATETTPIASALPTAAAIGSTRSARRKFKLSSI
jgi:hypothetical protein